MMLVAQLTMPTPQPDNGLKTITTVRASAFCNTVRSLAVPVGFVNQRNDEAFDAINRAMLKFVANNKTVGSASQNELATMANEYDDSATYNPRNTASMNQLSEIVWQINQNLSLEDDVMQKSWTKYPQGKDEQIDLMRQRLQNLIDLQRSMASNYTALATMYFDNIGMAATHTDQQSGDAGDAAKFKAVLRNVIFGQVAAMALANRPDYDASGAAQANASNVAQAGTLADVVEQLRLQEDAFRPEIVRAGNACGI